MAAPRAEGSAAKGAGAASTRMVETVEGMEARAEAAGAGEGTLARAIPAAGATGAMALRMKRRNMLREAGTSSLADAIDSGARGCIARPSAARRAQFLWKAQLILTRAFINFSSDPTARWEDGLCGRIHGFSEQA